MGRRWSKRSPHDYVESPVEVEIFMDDLEALMRRHNIFLSHEDGQGAFELTRSDTVDWIRAAALDDYDDFRDASNG